MKPKPKKKEVKGYEHNCSDDICCTGCIQNGKNQTIEEYEAFLPSEEELLKLIRDIGAPKGLPLSLSHNLVKAIYKRQRGEE